jgi:hypothetical protein
MTITTTVDATWRVGRVEIDTPNGAPGTVRGVGEVVIAQPAGGERGSGLITFGSIVGESVSRKIDDVLSDTVEMSGGTSVSWLTVMEAIPLFIEKWRTEDIQNPPERMIPQKPAAPSSNVPDYSGLPIIGKGELPPPKPV